MGELSTLNVIFFTLPWVLFSSEHCLSIFEVSSPLYRPVGWFIFVEGDLVQGLLKNSSAFWGTENKIAGSCLQKVYILLF